MMVSQKMIDRLERDRASSERDVAVARWLQERGGAELWSTQVQNGRLTAYAVGGQMLLVLTNGHYSCSIFTEHRGQDIGAALADADKIVRANARRGTRP